MLIRTVHWSSKRLRRIFLKLQVIVNSKSLTRENFLRLLLLRSSGGQNHRCTQGVKRGGGKKQKTLRDFFLNKNTKILYPHINYFALLWTPYTKYFGKTFNTLPMDFQLLCIYGQNADLTSNELYWIISLSFSLSFSLFSLPLSLSSTLSPFFFSFFNLR